MVLNNYISININVLWETSLIVNNHYCHKLYFIKILKYIISIYKRNIPKLFYYEWRAVIILKLNPILFNIYIFTKTFKLHIYILNKINYIS